LLAPGHGGRFAVTADARATIGPMVTTAFCWERNAALSRFSRDFRRTAWLDVELLMPGGETVQ
jgi:hypothetical protein